MAVDRQQVTDTVAMIRPSAFGYNPETAETNAFQRSAASRQHAGVHRRAVDEFDKAVDGLTAAGVDVVVFEDAATPEAPDAIFPNNWISFHASGTIVIYPMLNASRRSEVRLDIAHAMSERFGFGRIADLREEHAGGALEGTGSLVLDRRHRVAYAARSGRTDEKLVRAFARSFDYEPVLFTATDVQRRPFYHTNVMFTLGDTFAVVCLESVLDTGERKSLVDRLSSSGHDIVAITLQQVQSFAGNMLQLTNRSGDSLIAMSAAALRSLDPTQLARLEQRGRILPFELPTIERHGGGSIRCMIAEVFVPQRRPADSRERGCGSS